MTSETSSKVKLDEVWFPISYTAGGPDSSLLPIREGVNPRLGKRYSCAQYFQGENSKGQKIEFDRSGIVNTEDGRNIYLGCGTEVLFTQPREGGSAPLYCCDMPMTEQHQRKVPSVD